MKHSWFEVIAGFVALSCAVGFVLYALDTRRTTQGAQAPQRFIAHFSSSRGIKNGSEVRINGVPVGKVESIHIDPQVFEVVVGVSISGAFRVPFDSALEIASPLLLGDPYLTLIPGQETIYLQGGDRIVSTRAHPSFEELLERAVFLVGEQAR